MTLELRHFFLDLVYLQLTRVVVNDAYPIAALDDLVAANDQTVSRRQTLIHHGTIRV
jgi:hypothetical protein